MAMVLPNTLASYPLEDLEKHDRKQPSLVLESQGPRRKPFDTTRHLTMTRVYFKRSKQEALPRSIAGTETRYPFERQILAELSLSLTPTCVSKEQPPKFSRCKAEEQKITRGFPHPRRNYFREKREAPKDQARNENSVFALHLYITTFYCDTSMASVSDFSRLKLPFWPPINVVIEKLPSTSFVQLIHFVVISPSCQSDFRINFFIGNQNHFPVFCRQTIREIF